MRHVIPQPYLQKLIRHIDKGDGWHVPPADKAAYQKVHPSSFREAEVWGRPLDQPQKVTVSNPLVGVKDKPWVGDSNLPRPTSFQAPFL
jgi:hypothetical protein